MTLDKLLEEAANRYAMEVLGKTEEDLAYVAPECRPALSRQVKIIAELLYEEMVDTSCYLSRQIDYLDDRISELNRRVRDLESK